MSYYLITLTFWHWWLAATALALLDVFWPRARLRFVAIGTALAGFVLLLSPGLFWGWQWALFAGVTVIGAGLSVYRALRTKRQRLAANKAVTVEPRVE